MKHDEAHIIQEILSGKTARYEYFLDKYGQKVLNLIAPIVSCQEDAEELTQDVFLKAFQQLSSFKETSSFSTWIYRIAYNAAVSATRKKKLEVFHWDNEAFSRLSDSRVNEALEDDSEEQLQRLSSAMEKLEVEERVLVTLYYMEEKSMAEIAFIQGMKENNVKVKLHRIRKKLYLLIKQEE